MFFSFSVVFAATSLLSQVRAHYTFPSLIVNGGVTPAWTNVRRTNNYQTNSPVTDVKSADFRCYNSQGAQSAVTIPVTAGSSIGIESNDNIYHPGVVNVYMAKAPGNVSSWNGDGAVWFKVYQISAVTDGGKTISFPATGVKGVSFNLPKSLPNGEYLVRMEAIALHSASSYGGAQFYISCGQVSVSGGGSGKPAPLVSIPGVYTGSEPGIQLNIYYPIPATYVQPGPAVWTG